ncbi:MAG: biliverdin-producing heme oxygenase [Chitinophagaceae bacterium]
MTEKENIFLTDLRNRTASHHQSLERLPVSVKLISDEVTIEDYTAYLKIMYGFTLVFEEIVFPRIAHLLPEIKSRRKISLLLNDLHFLGIDPGNKLADKNVLQNYYCTNASALGGMYVMEGSTLGSQFICRHIEKKLGAQVKGAMSYFEGYGEKTGSMWKAFLKTFAEISVGENQEEQTIEAAEHTFKMLEDWMHKS